MDLLLTNAAVTQPKKCLDPTVELDFRPTMDPYAWTFSKDSDSNRIVCHPRMESSKVGIKEHRLYPIGHLWPNNEVWLTGVVLVILLPSVEHFASESLVIPCSEAPELFFDSL